MWLLYRSYVLMPDLSAAFKRVTVHLHCLLEMDSKLGILFLSVVAVALGQGKLYNPFCICTLCYYLYT